MRYATFNWRRLAVLGACLLVAACGDGGSASAEHAANGASTDAAAANGGNGSDSGNGTPTGLPPAPWAADSSAQPASGALLPPVIHTVDD